VASLLLFAGLIERLRLMERYWLVIVMRTIAAIVSIQLRKLQL
jgi:hypothetical protein